MSNSTLQEKNVELSQKILSQLFTRHDCYGTCGQLKDSKKVERYQEKAEVTESIIANHLSGQIVISAYCLSSDNFCKWIAFDLDGNKEAKKEYLKGNPVPLQEDKKILLIEAQKIYNFLKSEGILAVIEDSTGGYHIWILLDTTIASSDAYAFSHSIPSHIPATENLEIYPKQEKIPSDGYGNCLRIPGRYHSTAKDYSAIYTESGDLISFKNMAAWDYFLKQVNPSGKIQEFLAKYPPEPEPAPPIIPTVKRQIFSTVGQQSITATTDIDSWIDERLQKFDLFEWMYGRYGLQKVKRYTKRISFCCPFHEDGTPSAWIAKNEKGIDFFHCKVAQDTGGACLVTGLHAIGILTKHEGKTLSEACQELFGEVPINPVKEITCKYCGMTGLQWAKDERKRFLVTEDGVKHSCKGRAANMNSQALDCFWYEEEKGKNKDTVLQVSNFKLIKFLEKAGFCFILTDKQSEIKRLMVRIQNHIVEETDIPFIQKYTWEFIENWPGEMVTKNHSKAELRELFKRGMGNYINEMTVNLIYSPRLNFLVDTQDTAYIPFKNGIVNINRDSVWLEPYDKFASNGNGKYLWKSQIIQHDFEFIPNHAWKMEDFEFYKFLKNVCSDREKNELDKERFASLVCCIGYLLHNYRTAANKYAIIFSEASLSEEPQGRTGKGLILQAIGKIRKVVTIDGRNFNIESPFAFQNATMDTQILFFDDTKRTFEFQRLFSVITEGLSFEKKGKDRVNLPPEESPKIAISTNYSLAGNSASDKGRRFEIELLVFYDNERTPFKEFGHYFFEEWNEKDWNKFYLVMINCLQEFLKHNCNIPKYTAKALAEKKLLLETSLDFVEFMQPRETENLGEMYTAIKIGEEHKYNTSSKYDEFIHFIAGGDDELKAKSKVSITKFTKWLKTYANYKNLDYRTFSNGKIRGFYMIPKNLN